MRAFVVVLVLALATTVAPAVPAPRVFAHHPATGVPASDVIVAVIDTGAYGSHAEFGGYRGQAGVTDPQIVAWWDFGAHGPAPAGATWDTVTPVPFDGCDPICHGTGTASLVGGATVGANPGVKLAIAKVANAAGDLVNVADAVRWAVETVGADVVSMSLGTIAPIPGALVDFDDAVAAAQEAGVLVVVSAGNGLGNAGARYPSELAQPSGSTRALVVGAVGKTATTQARLTGATFSNTDPDVVSWGASVKMATSGGGFQTSSGTSFSTPLVAGWAALVLDAARDAGRPDDPARIERILSWTAHDDPAVPFAIEGYGFVAHGSWSTRDTVGPAIAHAAAGTLPPAPAQAAVADGAETVRAAWTDTTTATIVAQTGGSTPGFVGASAASMRDIDLYTLSLSPLDTLDVRVSWTDSLADPSGANANDVDIFLYAPGAGENGIFSHADLSALSTRPGVPGDNAESFTHRARASGIYTLSVEGWVVGPEGQAYTLTVTINGVAAPSTFLGDHAGLVGKNT